MIPNDVSVFELRERILRFANPFVPKKGKSIPAGMLCVVEGTSGVKMKLLDVRSLPCPKCGQYFVVSRVPREILEFANEPRPLVDYLSIPPGAFRIPRKYTATMLEGRACHLVENTENRAGQGDSPATRCRIISAHCGVTIKTNECLACGLSAYIAKIPRSNVFLAGQEDMEGDV